MTEPAKTMLHVVRRGLVVFVNDEHAPSDAEWDAYLDTVRTTGKTGSVRILIASGGGAPTAKQRKAAALIAKTVGIKSALVSDSMLARSIVTALGWMGVDIKAFNWKEMDRAFAYLEVSEVDIRWALEVIKDLQKELAGTSR